jgi:hypothetical protein
VRNKLKNMVFQNDRILPKPTVKSGRCERVCETESIWAIENLGRKIPNDSFSECGQLIKLANSKTWSSGIDLSIGKRGQIIQNRIF